MQTIYYILLTFFLILSFFLVMLVLIQKGKGGGLSAAFGGVGGNTAFGAKTGDVLTWATSIVFAVFIILGIGLNLLANRIHADNTDIARNTATGVSTNDTGNGSSDDAMQPKQSATPEAPKDATSKPATQPDASAPAASTTSPTTKPAN